MKEQDTNHEDLIVLTNNDKQRILNILEHYADK